MPDQPDALPVEKIQGAVTFEGVTFGYDPDKPVLVDVSLSATPGQTIALVGPTGAGKTTIINLLSRFYDVDAGAITIDGHDIRTVQQASIRKQLGIVLQDTFLFSGTVMENIRYGRLEASDDEVYAAAKLANADWFIRRLPQGYQTQVSEQGHNFSQGQRQLLAIARAILADPRILILDEATSSVDTRTEMLIQEALLQPDGGPHGLCHRPPPEHHPLRRPGAGDRRRPDHRARQSRVPAGAAGVLSQPVHEPVPADSSMTF